jgi:hypothetical protein
MRKCFGLAILPLFFAFCPSLSAVGYTWDFTGSAGTNCPVTAGPNACADPGNSMTFTSNGVTVTVSAWYITGNGTLKSATLGQYSSGLGDCYPSQPCSGSNEQVGNNGVDEFLLLQFSAPIDPTSITLDSPTGGGLAASYWLGSTANQSTNLTNMNITTSLSTLGFGSQQTGTGGTSVGTVDFGGPPSTSVNAILFGPQYGYSGDFFDVSGLSGASPASVPEPASIFLLFTVAVAAFGLRRRAAKQPVPSVDKHTL